MTIIETAKVTTKGQVTIPNRIRKLLHLEEGSSIAFGIGKNGVMLMPCEVTAKSPYTPKEWQQIEKLASANGKTFASSEAARNYLASL
jgi:AbrB family looped-hinge helix DNA binding protein